MLNRKTCTTLALTLTLVASPLLGAETESDPHHPAGAAAAPNSSMMPGCIMPTAEGGIRMTAEHIEGRLAFLKTELKITDAQLPLWNAFAQAMRDIATAMQAVPHTMMGKNNGDASRQARRARDNAGGAARDCTQTEGGHRSSLHGAGHRPEEDGRRAHARSNGHDDVAASTG